MVVTAWGIRVADLSDEPVAALVRLHLDGMHAHSPAGSVYALDFSGLAAPEVTMWSAWQNGAIAGIAAFKELGDGRAELKSMRTHPRFLRRGVAAALLEHIIGVAKCRRMSCLSLETGSGAYFEAALALYRRRGFVEGIEFSDYKRSAFNRFLHLTL
jgi:putative acetyltransferase